MRKFAVGDRSTHYLLNGCGIATVAIAFAAFAPKRRRAEDHFTLSLVRRSAVARPSRSGIARAIRSKIDEV